MLPPYIRRHCLLPLLSLALIATVSAAEPSQPQFRAVWVDGFHAGIRTAAEADQLVADAKTAGLNALIVQVRRRGDALYTKSFEPPVEDPAYAPDFDGLAYLVEKAHAAGLEVHAWMNAAPLWRNQPPPKDPRHVFNRHGPSAIGPDNWLTRDPSGNMVFPVGYFLDPGHPGAASHIASVARNLVSNYAIDGIHLDYIRYPETADFKSDGAPVGYSEVSLDRFRKRHGLSNSTPPPAMNDTRWSDWRREQVTQLVRRIYLEVMEVNPRIRVSAAVISWGEGPADPREWPRSHAYNRIYQDWQGWLKEGILDLAVPMNYFKQADAGRRAWYERWIEFEKRGKHGRHMAVGIGAYMNTTQDNLDQLRRAMAPARRGRHRVEGFSLFSYANNAKTLPELRKLFPSPASVPPMQWKERPDRGYLCGIVAGADGENVRIERKIWWGWSRKAVTTDGNGFFGVVGLKPGFYRVAIPARQFLSAGVQVQPGKVTRIDVGKK